MQINNSNSTIQQIMFDANVTVGKQTFTGLNNVLTSANVFVDPRTDSFTRTTNNDEVTKEDALKEAYKTQYGSFNLDDPQSVIDSAKFLTATKEDYEIFLKQLEENGATDEMNAVTTFSLGDISNVNLEERINEFAALYVNSKNKIESNLTGDELIAQQEQLDKYYKDAYNSIVNELTANIQDGAFLTDEETQKVKDSFAHIIDEKISSYQATYDEIASTIDGKDEWLKSVDSYMTSQMHASNNDTVEATEDTFSLNDLVRLNDIASHNVNANASDLYVGLDLASVDMKLSTMISDGELSDDMAELLTKVVANKKEDVLSNTENAELVENIYNEVMSNFNSNGGNVSNAIKDSIGEIQTLISENTKGDKLTDTSLNHVKSFFDEKARSDKEIGFAKYCGVEISSTTSSFNNYMESYNKLFETRY